MYYKHPHNFIYKLATVVTTWNLYIRTYTYMIFYIILFEIFEKCLLCTVYTYRNDITFYYVQFTPNVHYIKIILLQ